MAIAEFLSQNWLWAIPLAVAVIGIVGYVLLLLFGINDWMNKGSH